MCMKNKFAVKVLFCGFLFVSFAVAQDFPPLRTMFEWQTSERGAYDYYKHVVASGVGTRGADDWFLTLAYKEANKNTLTIAISLKREKNVFPVRNSLGQIISREDNVQRAHNLAQRYGGNYEIVSVPKAQTALPTPSRTATQVTISLGDSLHFSNTQKFTGTISPQRSSAERLVILFNDSNLIAAFETPVKLRMIRIDGSNWHIQALLGSGSHSFLPSVAAKKRQAENARMREAERQRMKAESEAGAGTFTDPRNNKIYRTVRIGNLTWMSENLNFAADKSWCSDSRTENCDKYGRLYPFEAALDACPAGWRLPTIEEWGNLVVAAGGGEDAGGVLKSQTGWLFNGNGTDSFGFSALPGGACWQNGRRREGHPNFRIGDNGYWWTATEAESSVANAYCVAMFSNNSSVSLRDFGKGVGLSVRCVRE